MVVAAARFMEIATVRALEVLSLHYHDAVENALAGSIKTMRATVSARRIGSAEERKQEVSDSAAFVKRAGEVYLKAARNAMVVAKPQGDPDTDPQYLPPCRVPEWPFMLCVVLRRRLGNVWTIPAGVFPSSHSSER
jgi:hypothetical protein